MRSVVIIVLLVGLVVSGCSNESPNIGEQTNKTPSIKPYMLKDVTFDYSECLEYLDPYDMTRKSSGFC